MRRLSLKWPVWATVLALAMPAFYVYQSVLRPAVSGMPLTFRAEEFLAKILGAVFFTIVAWFIYGVACLLAAPLRDTSEEKPWKPSDDFHIEVNRGEGQDVSVSEQDSDVAAAPELQERPPAKKNCGLAIISLILGILGLVLFCVAILPGLPAVICGHLALSKIKRSHNILGGRGMAIAGLSMGYIAIAFTALLFVAGPPAIKNRVSAYLEKLVEKNPIYFAAAAGNLQKVDSLISEGANPNAKSIKGHTPLIAATRGHHSLIAEHLLLAGANPDQKDDWGWAALHHAITPTDGADLDLIGILVKHGANVNIQDNRLRTPLHRAAQYGQLQAVVLLLKYGADANIRDYNGWTPADRAAAHPEIQSLLMSEKSDGGTQVSELTEFPEYFSEKHNFKVRFPGKAKVIDHGPATHYTVEVEAEGAYNIIVQSFPKPVLSDEAIEAALDGHLQGRLALFGDAAAVLESRHIVFAEHKALQYEYTVESQGTVACFKGVYFVVGEFGYGVSCVCTDESKRLVYRKYDNFAKSFHLISR